MVCIVTLNHRKFFHDLLRTSVEISLYQTRHKTLMFWFWLVISCCSVKSPWYCCVLCPRSSNSPYVDVLVSCVECLVFIHPSIFQRERQQFSDFIFYLNWFCVLLVLQQGRQTRSEEQIAKVRPFTSVSPSPFAIWIQKKSTFIRC